MKTTTTKKANANNAQSTQGGNTNNQHSGRGPAGGGRGDQSGRGGGRGRGRGAGRGYEHRTFERTFADTKTIEIPADVNTPIPPDRWTLLTRDQQFEGFDRRGTRYTAANTTATAPAAAATSTTTTATARNVNIAATSYAAAASSGTAPTAETARNDNTTRGHAVRSFLGQEQPSPHTLLEPSPHTRFANIAQSRTYRVVSLDLDKHSASTVDRGASGGVWGADGRILTEDKFHKIEVTGVGGLKLTDLSTVTAVAKLKSDKGWVVGEFHNYAYSATGKTIHSSMQMEAFGLNVNDKHYNFGGKLRIETPDGYTFMLGMDGGMATLPMFPVSNSDLKKLPRVMMTFDGPWDPSQYDVAVDEVVNTPIEYDDEDMPALEERGSDSDSEDDEEDGYAVVTRSRSKSRRESNKAYSNIGIDNEPVYTEQELNVCAAVQKYSADLVYQPYKSILPKKPDIEALKPNFAWHPTQTIKETLRHSTQFNMHERRYPPRMHRKSRFVNIYRIDDMVAHDTMFFDEPAIDDHIDGHAGCVCAQLFYGTRSQIIVVYPMRTKADVPKRFRDFIREFGAPLEVFSDNAKEAMSAEFDEVMREFMVRRRHTSEPYYQNQNPAERIIGHVKESHERLMDRTGTPACFWLRALLFETEMRRHLSHPALGGKSPMEFITGRVPDISKYLHFRWFEIVNYFVKDIQVPGTRQRAAYWLGPNTTCGDDLTYFICDCETHEIMTRSVCLKRNDPQFLNLRVPAPVSPVIKEGEPRLYTVPGLGGEIIMPEMLKKISNADADNNDDEDEDDVPDLLDRDDDSLDPEEAEMAVAGENPVSGHGELESERAKSDKHNVNPWRMPKYAPDELIGKSFLMKTEDGQEV